MKVTVAKNAGFCFGVKRATLMAFEKAAEKGGGKICTLGPIIHSPQVVERLEQQGVDVIHDLGEISSGSVILRSHGVTAQEHAEAISKGLEVIDATCPYVTKAQEHVRRLSGEGYDVVVVGEKDHPEVQGIVSYAANRFFVVADGEGAISLPRMNKCGVVAQTTQSYDTLSSVISVCLTKTKELRIFNTICDATSVRQEEAKLLASESDCVIVIGGYNSGNTRRLAEICREICDDTYHIESVSDLCSEWFDHKMNVGITAGASTPKWLIDEVLQRVNAIITDNNS